MRSRCLVWIDTDEAVIVHWQADRAHIVRIDSQVPAHHRSTGHVRHDPMVRHGGGRAQNADERRREERIEQFLDAVIARLEPAEDVLILGPGTVREHLERRLREMDRAQTTGRLVASEPSQRRTERQLVARLRHDIGDEPRRRGVDGRHPAGSGARRS
jgi:hypothetical protein